MRSPCLFSVQRLWSFHYKLLSMEILLNVIAFTEKKWWELLTLRFKYDKLGQDAKAGHNYGEFHPKNVLEDSSKRAYSK